MAHRIAWFGSNASDASGSFDVAAVRYVKHRHMTMVTSLALNPEVATAAKPLSLESALL
jgi:hypothetical protein